MELSKVPDLSLSVITFSLALFLLLVFLVDISVLVAGVVLGAVSSPGAWLPAEPLCSSAVERRRRRCGHHKLQICQLRHEVRRQGGPLRLGEPADRTPDKVSGATVNIAASF